MSLEKDGTDLIRVTALGGGHHNIYQVFLSSQDISRASESAYYVLLAYQKPVLSRSWCRNPQNLCVSEDTTVGDALPPSRRPPGRGL